MHHLPSQIYSHGWSPKEIPGYVSGSTGFPSKVSQHRGITVTALVGTGHTFPFAIAIASNT